jgi:hypothetical protein
MKEGCPLAWQNNTARLCGTVDADSVFSHRSRGADYYSFPLLTRRLSGAADRLNVTLPAFLLPGIPPAGQRLALRGEVRSFANRSGEGNRLLLYVYAQDLLPPEDEDQNEAELAGTLCREPTWRRTPMGREICDLMLAVPRRYGRGDYLPCIAWGRNAQEAAAWRQGRPVRLTGRFQSRNYIKVTETGSLQRTAFEISVTSFLPEA